MSNRLVGIRNGLITAACLSLSLVGCWSAPPSSGLPATVPLLLPDGTTVDVGQGSGAASLADSQWQFFRTGSTQAFFAINFGPDGNLESFEGNTLIAPNIFGDSIRFDGQRHVTAQQGLEYAAATFGAETGDASGFTFEGHLTAFFLGIQAGTGTATATASYVADDPNTVEGIFDYSTHVTLASIPGGNTADKFDFVGHRVP